MIHILLATYNGERYLKAQLDSVFAQTYTDWQLFIRDDGSNDTTMQIAQSYAAKEPRITIIQDGESLGACRSFERLLTQCGGADYYAFCDQDDVWKPEKLALSIDTIQRAEAAHPDKPIVVHTDLQVVDEQLEEIAPSFWQYSHIRPELQNTHIHYLAISNSVTGCTMLFNEAARSCALPIGPNAYMHDAWTALMTAVHGGFIIPIHKCLLAYRQHGDNGVGAVQFSVAKRGLTDRRSVSMRNYEMAHPHVYANKVQFYWWKLIYLLHRALYCVTRK